MKVVILAGGFGTRLSELTHSIPKPMVEVGNIPLIFHIMNHYSKFQHCEFIIATGYKSDYVKKYFLDYMNTKDDFSIDMKNNSIKKFNEHSLDWKVSVIDTGLHTMTGGRIKKLARYLEGEDFLLTYGDGLSNVPIDKTIDQFYRNKKKLLMTCVRPPARFGEVIVDNEDVLSFQEKPQLNEGWINGGFFVCKNSILNYIESDDEMFERQPMEKICKDKELTAFKHEGFWQCMDSIKDHNKLCSMWDSGNPPWK